MTLEILKDTILDLGPEYWAFIIVIALVIIEIFQLGPHTFGPKKLKKDDDEMGPMGVANKHRFNFKKLIININYNFGENEALLYVGDGDLVDKLVASAGAFASSDDESGGKKLSQSENYVLCRADDPVAEVTRQVLPLWSSKDDRSDAKYMAVYSRRAPSTYAVQQVAKTLSSYAKRVTVGVYYSEDDGEEGHLIQDRVDHLRKYNISMQKI